MAFQSDRAAAHCSAFFGFLLSFQFESFRSLLDLSSSSSYRKKVHIGESFGLPRPAFFLAVGIPTVGTPTLVSLSVDVDGESCESSNTPDKSTIISGWALLFPTACFFGLLELGSDAVFRLLLVVLAMSRGSTIATKDMSTRPQRESFKYFDVEQADAVEYVFHKQPNQPTNYALGSARSKSYIFYRRTWEPGIYARSVSSIFNSHPRCNLRKRFLRD